MTPLLADAIGWRSWEWQPTLLLPALLVVGAYVYGVRRLYPADRAQRVVFWRQVALFSAGALLLFLAIASPLDAAADRLLAFHMLQHVIMTTIAPPLIVLGLPPALLRKLLRRDRVASILRYLTNPFLAGGLFLANMWIWHAPPLYNAALDYQNIHIVQHLMFIGTGILFWWPVVNPVPEASSLGQGGRLLYLFITGFPMMTLALLFLSAQGVLYHHYADVQLLWGMSPLTDQQIAGIVMGVLGELASFAAFSVLFFRFMVSELSEDEPAPTPAVR